MKAREETDLYREDLIPGPEHLGLPPRGFSSVSATRILLSNVGQYGPPPFVCFSEASWNRVSGICNPKNPD